MSSQRYDRSERLRPMGGLQPPDGERRRFAGTGPVNKRPVPEKGKKSFLSVVVPTKNEAASLAQLIDEITWALRPLTQPGRTELDGFEIVVVDDASTDPSRSVLQELATLYPELKRLVLATSVGQSAATMAGIRAARGNWIATLDADLQNDPADLIRLWRALPGHDAVLGWRVRRQDVWSKRLISYWANLLRNKVLGQSIRDTGCSVRIFPALSLCDCRRSTACTGFSARSCCARDAAWFKYPFIIDHGLTAGRITIFGTGHSRWSSTCSELSG